MDLVRRRALLTAALGFRLLNLDDPAGRALAAWMDSWSGVGAVMGGMLRQGFEVDLNSGSHGWSAYFFARRPEGGAPDVIGTANEATPWRAVQRAAWAALNRSPVLSPALAPSR